MDADALYREHAHGLRRYLFRLTGDLDGADDALQETFLRALRSPPSEPGNPRAWLYTVATNVVRDQSRRAGLAGRVDPAMVAAASHAQCAESKPAERLERLDLRRRLTAALQTLTVREREALLMREAGFTHREIAEALGTTTGTIGTLLARALAKMARALPLDGGEA